MKKAFCVLVWTGALASASPASAALIERNFVLTGLDAEGPFSTLNLSFNLTFENSKDIATTSSGLTLLEAPSDYSLSYAYDAKDDILAVGTNVDIRQYGLTYWQKDIGFFISLATTAAAYTTQIRYTHLSNVAYESNKVTLVTRDLSAAVPEPATWMMMMLGFGAVGYAMRRKKAVVRFA